MTRKLHIDRVLVYHDFPELFLAKDSVGLDYLCLLIQNESDAYEYCCVSISKSNLYKFLNGKLDLRQIFTDPEIREWWSAVDTSEAQFTATILDIEQLQENYLPASGYFFTDERQDDVIREEVVEHENVIIHLSLSDEYDNQSISIEDLGNFSRLYQSLVENAFKKAILNSQINDKKSFITTQNYSLRAFAASPGSFNLHLKSGAAKDIFGKSIIEEGLRKIDDVIQNTDNETLIEKLRTIKGHAISNYKRLLEKVINQNITFKYKWMSPDSPEIHQRTISQEYAQRVKEILVLKDELSEEIKEFIGFVKQADVERGSWRITNEDDSKDYSGESDGRFLDGITLETVKYKFTCAEVVETLRVTEKEKTKYVLKTVEKLE